VSDKRKLLIVGDDPTTQNPLLGVLADDEYRLSFASSGPSVVFQFLFDQPDLVIFDLQSLGEDDEKTIRQIRASASAPMIVLCALAEHGTKMKCLSVGADDFLAKPFSGRELRARVRALLRRADNTASLSRGADPAWPTAQALAGSA
jgi:DNA-binding response OmpR family regulator